MKFSCPRASVAQAVEERDPQQITDLVEQPDHDIAETRKSAFRNGERQQNEARSNKRGK